MKSFENKTESKEKEPLFVIRISNREEELERINDHLEDIQSLKEVGYFSDRVILPEYYRNIVEKILSGKIKLKDVDSKEFNEALEYSEEDYKEPKEQIHQEIDSMKNKTEEIFDLFSQWNEKWGFKIFKNYPIILTRYGTEGSYIHQSGSIIMRIDSESSYRIVIHEMVHIGIEEVIIRKYNFIPKERLVNLICANVLEVPGYKLKVSNDPAIAELDKHITKNTINNLTQEIETYLKHTYRQRI